MVIKSKKALAIISGIAALLAVAYSIFVFVSTNQTKVSCHSLKPTTTSTEYCVYYASAPGLLSTTNTILIGPSSGRGIEYTVPYALQDVKVDWNDTTDVLTITMPDTQLIINPGAYVDSR